MGNMKSGLNLLEVLTALSKDMTLISSKDLQTCARRLEHEGVSFLTKSFPILGKAFDAGLEEGLFSCPSLFKRYKRTALPAFLRGLLTFVFDDNGYLLQNPSIEAIRDLRQLLYFFNKVKTEPTNQQKIDAVKKFLLLEASNRTFDNCKIEGESYDLLRSAAIMGQDILKDLDLKNIVPCDGPGAVADKRSHWARVQFDVLYGDIHGKYPYYSYYMYSSSDLIGRVRNYKSAKRLDHGSSRFCLVPKDSKGPRIITIEPAEYQYIQQGQRKNFVHYLENHPVTKGFINFSDQGVNRELARLSSIDRQLDTIDLSDASDRVTSRLVEALVGPHHWEYLNASRSKDVVIPKSITGIDDIKVAVHKFAGMGSAMCFPIEAFCFFVLARAYLLSKGCYAKPYIYGDDIILPTGHREGFTSFLLEMNLIVNKTKSFSKGFFRESCGGDFYLGHDVTPIRLRVSGTARVDILSLIETSNQLHSKFLWNTEKVLNKLVVSLAGNTPLYSGVNLPGASFTQFHSRSNDAALVFGKDKRRWNKRFQRWLRPFFGKAVSNVTDDSHALLLRWSGKTKGTDRSAEIFSVPSNKVSLKFL